jgi:hypothetical protein
MKRIQLNLDYTQHSSLKALADKSGMPLESYITFLLTLNEDQDILEDALLGIPEKYHPLNIWEDYSK